MQDRSDLDVRCAAMIAALDTELAWHLSDDMRREYHRVIQPLLPGACSDTQLRTIVTCYHLDHGLVEALADRRHIQHDPSWHAWMQQAVPILRRSGLDWSDDAAVDWEDLAQIARTALARALPSFRYASRFSTWAHQVIVRSVQRYVRDRQTGKRAGRPTSLQAIPSDQLPISEFGRPEPIANARVFAALIDDILRAQPDQRLALIFRLWVSEDARVEEIGRRVQLSPSQVRALLGQIRTILQNEPSIRAWRDQEETGRE